MGSPSSQNISSFYFLLMTDSQAVGMKYDHGGGEGVGDDKDEASNVDVSDVDVGSWKIGDVDVQRQQSQ